MYDTLLQVRRHGRLVFVRRSAAPLSIFENRRTVDGEWTELSYKKCENRGTCCRTLIFAKIVKTVEQTSILLGSGKQARGQ